MMFFLLSKCRQSVWRWGHATMRLEPRQKKFDNLRWHPNHAESHSMESFNGPTQLAEQKVSIGIIVKPFTHSWALRVWIPSCPCVCWVAQRKLVGIMLFLALVPANVVLDKQLHLGRQMVEFCAQCYFPNLIRFTFQSDEFEPNKCFLAELNFCGPHKDETDPGLKMAPNIRSVCMKYNCGRRPEQFPKQVQRRHTCVSEVMYVLCILIGATENSQPTRNKIFVVKLDAVLYLERK